MKRLYRSRKNRMLGGVCGGIAEYFEIDPVIVRLIAVALFFVGGSAILAYIIALIVIPYEPGGRAARDRFNDPCGGDSPPGQRRGRALVPGHRAHHPRRPFPDAQPAHLQPGLLLGPPLRAPFLLAFAADRLRRIPDRQGLEEIEIELTGIRTQRKVEGVRCKVRY
jgi:phage shock protein PspC (stress-responsive transcriptional regulator)